MDSTVKRLIRDSLPAIVDHDEGACLQFKDHIEKRLRDDGTSKRFLADILGDRSPHKLLLDRLVGDLTCDSLQSAEQLLKVAAYFNIPSRQISTDITQLKAIFAVAIKLAMKWT